ncbi:MAG: hypothetical protein GX425_04750, partial [Peptococcaceae bacterium]|nr:hypothetical protein [Peptococcaceae bacterium]
ALLGVPLRWKRIIAAGTVLALVFYAARSLQLTFGLHTAVGIFFLVVVISRFTYMPVTKIFVAVFISFFTLTLLELVGMKIFFTATDLDPNTTIVENNNVLWVLSGLPQAFLLNIFALLVAKFKKPREDTWRV